MSSTATPVVLKLSFSKFAGRVRAAGALLEDSKSEIQRQIHQQAPSWASAHVKMAKNTDVIELTGTKNDPDWNDNVRKAIEKQLRYHLNTAGRNVTLRAEGDK